jgi:hypothetical protein
MKEKREWICAALSFFFGNFGYIYAGWRNFFASIAGSFVGYVVLSLIFRDAFAAYNRFALETPIISYFLPMLPLSLYAFRLVYNRNDFIGEVARVFGHDQVLKNKYIKKHIRNWLSLTTLIELFLFSVGLVGSVCIIISMVQMFEGGHWVWGLFLFCILSVPSYAFIASFGIANALKGSLVNKINKTCSLFGNVNAGPNSSSPSIQERRGRRDA